MTEQKTALVIGGAGFIGHNLVKRLKEQGWWVRAVDKKPRPDFELSPADEYIQHDCTEEPFAGLYSIGFDRIYQLAADMGGAGFVFTGDNDAEILTNSVLINLNLLKELKRIDYKGQVFYSSSVCIYSPEAAENTANEEDAYPASADSNYGWEKLYSERLYEAYARNYGLDIRIARFNNTYGPHGVFQGGREKSPAAVCRKVIQADNEIEIWGNGEQVREFVYIDDLLDGIETLMNSNYRQPVNIGPDDAYTINQLVSCAELVENKKLNRKYVEGPIGLQIRRTGNSIIKSLGWTPKISLKEGIEKTYLWIKEQFKE